MNGTAKDAYGRLTSGRLLARNVVWNLLGTASPLLVAVPAVPRLIHGIGTDRFGVLTLAWVVIGYFGLFDFGFGRALTKLVAEKLGSGQGNEIPGLFWTCLALMLVFGCVGGAVMAALSPWMVHSVLHVPVGIQTETLRAFYLLAASLPVVITTTALRGLLEAYQRFALSNAVRVPMGVLTFLGPLLVLPFSKSLFSIVGVLAAGRLIAWVIHLGFCLRVARELRGGFVWDAHAVEPLLRFGGWVTVANVVNPVLLFLDRFVIGAMLPVAMVGYYTAPFEAVTKVWIIPTSLTAPIFPACSALGLRRTEELEGLYARSLRFLFCAIAPISVVLVLLARPIIGAWLGPAFVDKSAVPLQFLAAGVFVNCFAHVPYCFLQGLGRPDLPAKLFLSELVPYGLLLWWMIARWGISGAAAAWSIRVAIEVLLLFWLSQRAFSLSPWHLLERKTRTALVVVCASGCAVYFLSVLLGGGTAMRIAICAAWLVVFVFAVWRWVLDRTDRSTALAAFWPLQKLNGRALETLEGD